jgi:hypothetical protein
MDRQDPTGGDPMLPDRGTAGRDAVPSATDSKEAALHAFRWSFLGEAATRFRSRATVHTTRSSLERRHR